jgi:Flp pilus assembly protein TadG
MLFVNPPSRDRNPPSREPCDSFRIRVRWRLWSCCSGQGLIETAAFLPVVLLMVAYAVDFGYFFVVAANILSSTRSAVEYSTQGYAAVGQGSLAPAGPTTSIQSVAALALGDLGGLLNSSSMTSVQVCSKANGVTTTATDCSSYGPPVSYSSATSPQIDPEAPIFYLNRVDVSYTLQPPVPMTFFSVSLLPSLSFHRHASMRVMD